MSLFTFLNVLNPQVDESSALGASSWPDPPGPEQAQAPGSLGDTRGCIGEATYGIEFDVEEKYSRAEMFREFARSKKQGKGGRILLGSLVRVFWSRYLPWCLLWTFSECIVK